MRSQSSPSPAHLATGHTRSRRQLRTLSRLREQWSDCRRNASATARVRLIAEFLDFSHLPLPDVTGHGPERAHGVPQDSDAPAEERPLSPPDVRSYQPVDDRQQRDHEEKYSKVDVETGDLLNLLCGLGSLFMLVHGYLPSDRSQELPELALTTSRPASEFSSASCGSSHPGASVPT